MYTSVVEALLSEQHYQLIDHLAYITGCMVRLWELALVDNKSVFLII